MYPRRYEAWTRLRHGVLLLLGLGGCSSSGPSEPVVLNLISIRLEPLPAAADRTFVKVGDGSFESHQIIVRAGAITLLPDKTWSMDFDFFRIVIPKDSLNQTIGDTVIVEDRGQQMGPAFGTYRWHRDTLFARIDGPPFPPGAAAVGCCSPGGTLVFKPVPGKPRQLLTFQGNDWAYVYERSDRR